MPAPVAKLSRSAEPPALTASYAVVIMADFTAAGDHVGYLPSINAPMPAACGDAIDVPDMKPAVSPL